jgi:hypothetical protein
MALPAELLAQLPRGVVRGSESRAEARARALPLGVAALDAALPDGGLLRGGVVELAVRGPGALATRLGLAACRAAQLEGRERGGATPWCAFVDPSRTLHAAGVLQAGVDLERLLVVRPSLEALGRVAARVVESQAFAVVVIDTLGVPGASLDVALGSWPRIVRRLALSMEGSAGTVLLITDAAARRPLPLPVALRLELARPRPNKLSLRVAKDRQGRVASPRVVTCDFVNSAFANSQHGAGGSQDELRSA